MTAASVGTNIALKRHFGYDLNQGYHIMEPIKIFNPGPLRSYLRVGCFLHLMTLVELFLLYMVISCFFVSAEDAMAAGSISKWVLASFLAALPIFSQLDARSRYQNYKQLKDQLFLYGFDRRIFKPVLQSRCQRDAAKAAAEDLRAPGKNQEKK
jgi:hypothetical protein